MKINQRLLAVQMVTPLYLKKRENERDRDRNI